jgi:hypothetical protein
MTATLVDIQRKVGVKADGVWGPETASAIAAALGLGARPPRRLRDPEAFFSAIRHSVFGGRLTQPQVDGVTLLLDAMGAAGWSIAWAAYGMATAAHETAKSMQPVREAYYLGEPAATNYRKGLRYSPFYGRGYVQLTWQKNYQHASDALGMGGALLADPDEALEPSVAAAVMVRGMEEGWFTGRSLPAALPAERGSYAQFVGARAIVNGSDKADAIAALAIQFQDSFSAGQWS